MSTTPQGGADPVAPEAVSGAQAAAAASNQSVPRDLTQDENFRKFQSETDRKFAAMQRELAEERARRAALEAERERASLQQLESLDPVEQVKVLKQRVEQQATAQTQAAQEQAFTQQAMAAVTNAGVDLNDPRIAQAWNSAGKPSAEAVAAVATTAAAIAAEKARAAQQELETLKRGAGQQTQQAAAVAANRALADAGVLATSNSGGVSVVPEGQRERDIADAKARFRKLAGHGHDSAAVNKFRDDLEAKGLSMRDLAN
jgi:hypothetical protein